MIRFPRVCISILNWNGLSDTLECLGSLYSQDYPNFEVVVVDNASHDNSVEAIRTSYPQAKLIINAENLGFTGGNNAVMRYAMQNGAEYIWLVNNDAVVEPDCLRRLVQCAESDASIGLVSPLIYYFDNRENLQFAAGRVINWESLSLSPGMDLDSLRRYNRDLLLWGTALLVKRQTVESVGYLKEEYFAYDEDIEYSLRTLRRGFRNAVCTAAVIYHKNNALIQKSGARSPLYYYLLFRNRLLLGREYLESVKGKAYFLREFLAFMLSGLGTCWRNGRLENVRALLNGVWHGLKRISGPMASEDAMPSVLQKLFTILASHHPFLLADIIMLNGGKIMRAANLRLGTPDRNAGQVLLTRKPYVLDRSGDRG
jgi:GT2 family glycosyltransferase